MTSLINKPSIFISREISADSILNNLTTLGFQIQGESLLTFKGLDFVYKQTDGWLFFYSSKGVHYFTQGILSGKLEQTQETLKGIKIAAMGIGTSRTLQAYEVKVDFIADSNIEKAVQEFKSLVQTDWVYFVQASQSMRTFQKRLKNQIKYKELVVYENAGKKDVNEIIADILVFTSPMNVATYFDFHQPTEDQQLIAIGPSTKDKILSYGAYSIDLPAHPSEEDIYDLISNKYI